MASRRLVGQITRGVKTHLDGATITQRDRVPLGWRQWGMFFTVVDDPIAANNTTWVLVEGLANTNKADNANWQTFRDWVTSQGVSPEQKTAYFDGDGANLEFVIDDVYNVSILSVYIGGQRMRKGAHYNVDNAAKKVTIIGLAPDVGQGVDVEYLRSASTMLSGVFDDYFSSEFE